ncbi:nucleotide pyrophosphatase/phosphodiesterase family protein [Metabacillus lacus]|nr:nucleotide pyrophosphatase/phosphodiesterase family protein [Metabacillus lacus]
MFKKKLCKTAIITSILFLQLCPLSAKAESERKTVTILSLDGMRNDLTSQYSQEGKLPHISRVMEEGITAEYAQSIAPSLTAPSHAAISTGAHPAKTGIVSNEMHKPGKNIDNTDDAFHTELEVNPLWKEAREQGKKTATVAFAGANPKIGKQGDYSIYYGKTLEDASLEELSFTPAKGWKQDVLPASYSPHLEAAVELKLKGRGNQTLYIAAIDSTDDGRKNYDFFVAATNKNSGGNVYSKHDWIPVELSASENETAGFWLKFKNTSGNLERAELFRTSVTTAVIDGPEGFADRIKGQFGFFPVQDEQKAFDNGEISRKEYEEIIVRFNEWVSDVSLDIKENEKPDLLMYYLPHADHEQHEYLLTDPRQEGYSEEKAEKYSKYVEWAYKEADRAVGRAVSALGEQDTLLLVSDHGMEPVHTEIHPNFILKKAGLLVTDEKGNIKDDETRAYAVGSGSAAHIYLNQKKGASGALTKEEYAEVRKEIEEAFHSVRITAPKRFAVVKEKGKDFRRSLKQEGLLAKKTFHMQRKQ